MQSAAVSAGERLSLANVPAPAPLVADEPLAPAFSLERAAQALDTSALHWQKTRKCAACHTMAPYLMARPALAAVSPEPPALTKKKEERHVDSAQNRTSGGSGVLIH